GMAASVEEMSYELGGALGVTLMGSLLSAVYSATLLLPAAADLPATVRDSLDEALLAAESLPRDQALLVGELARNAFDGGYVAVLAACTALLLAAALAVWRFQRRPG